MFPSCSKSVSSLLDLDDLIIGPVDQGQLGGGLSGLPPPLLPNMLFNMDPMGESGRLGFSKHGIESLYIYV